MTNTAHLAITLIEQSQAQKEITVNSALISLDALLNSGAKSRSTNTPPGSPAAGDLYIVGASPTGAWTGQARNLTYYDQAWQFITPNTGVTLWINDENLLYSYNGSQWVSYNSSPDDRIINGDMRIDQRNEGASLAISADNVYTLDRWVARLTGSLHYSVQQVSDAPTGFTNSLKYTITTAQSSLGSGDFCAIEQRIEGFNVADLLMGTANALSFMVDFWVKTSLAGTYALSVGNSSSFNRSYMTTFTVAAANTWQRVTCSIPGDTSGTWPTNNSTGMRIFISLVAGSSLQTSTTNAWQGAGYLNTSSCANLAATNGNTFQLAGVRLQSGSVIQPYTPRSFGQELMLCQRYYEKTFSPGTKPAQNAGTTDAVSVIGNAASAFGRSMEFYVTKRAVPTITTYSPSVSNANWRDTTNSADRTVTVGTVGQNSFIVTGASGSAGATNIIHFVADCDL